MSRKHSTASDAANPRARVRETSAKPVAEKFSDIVLRSRVGGRPVYPIIDEYDNFTNSMLRSEASRDYRSVTHGAGFYRCKTLIAKTAHLPPQPLPHAQGRELARPLL